MGGGVKREGWGGIELTWFYILGCLLLSIFIRDVVKVAMIFGHATYEMSRTQVGEPVSLFVASPAQTNHSLVLSADAITFVLFMLLCVYNSLLYIWT